MDNATGIDTIKAQIVDELSKEWPDLRKVANLVADGLVKALSEKAKFNPHTTLSDKQKNRIKLNAAADKREMIRDVRRRCKDIGISFDDLGLIAGLARGSMTVWASPTQRGPSYQNYMQLVNTLISLETAAKAHARTAPTPAQLKMVS